MCIDQIAETSKALLTPLIAIVAAYIAWQQWETNRRKLKLDLFDRRYKIFETISQFISSIISSGKVKEGVEFKFLIDTRTTEFLFRKEIADFVSEVYRNAVELHALDADLEGLTGDERSTNIKSQRAIKEWLGKELNGISRRFSRYLQMKH